MSPRQGKPGQSKYGPWIPVSAQGTTVPAACECVESAEGSLCSSALSCGKNLVPGPEPLFQWMVQGTGNETQGQEVIPTRWPV